jgi:hypothetical protein
MFKIVPNILIFLLNGPAANAKDAPQPWGLLCNSVMKKMRFFLLSQFNGAPVAWNWQGKPEVFGEKPVPVPLCPPQNPHGPTRDRTRNILNNYLCVCLRATRRHFIGCSKWMCSNSFLTSQNFRLCTLTTAAVFLSFGCGTRWNSFNPHKKCNKFT